MLLADLKSLFFNCQFKRAANFDFERHLNSSGENSTSTADAKYVAIAASIELGNKSLADQIFHDLKVCEQSTAFRIYHEARYFHYLGKHAQALSRYKKLGQFSDRYQFLGLLGQANILIFEQPKWFSRIFAAKV